MSKLIDRWETALAEISEPTEQDWGNILRNVDPVVWEAYGEDDAQVNSINEFMGAAEKWEIGKLTIDFPNSTHGDSSSVYVYRLPAGTVVLIRTATWERDEPSEIIFHGNDFNLLLTNTHELLFDDSDYGIIQNLDKNSDYNPDTNTTYEGEAKLREKWQSIPSK